MFTEFRKALNQIVEAGRNCAYRSEHNNAVSDAHTSVCASDAHGTPNSIKCCSENSHDIKPDALNIAVYRHSRTVFFCNVNIIPKSFPKIAQYIAVHSADAHLLSVIAEIKGALYIICSAVDRFFRGLQIVFGNVFESPEKTEQ